MVTIKNRPEVGPTEARYTAETGDQFLEKNKTRATLTLEWVRLLNADRGGARLRARWRLK
ncbi:MAG TPA: hypothetical protein PKD98_27330 [Anaerolineae bacterium]|nr:hypothetical protein [Anaerolineae bacterium]